MRQFLFCLCLLIHPVAALNSAVPETDVDVVAELRRSIARYNKSAVNAFVSRPVAGENGRLTSHRLKVRQFGTRALLSIKQTRELGSATHFSQKDFVVGEDGSVVDIQSELDSSLKQVPDHAGLIVVFHNKKLAGSQSVDRNVALCSAEDGAAAVWFIGYCPLLDYVDNASKIDVRRVEGDKFELAATSGFGRLKHTLSKSSGWLPERFELVKTSGDNFGALSLSEESRKLFSSVTWNVEVDSWSSTADGSKAPAVMTVTRRTDWKDGRTESESTNIRVLRVSFDAPLTDADFQSDLEIPVGHKVFVRGAGDLQYIWDGKAPIAAK